MSLPHTLMPVHPVLLVTIKFKRRIVMPNEFTVRLASTEFGDHFTVEKLIEEAYRKLTNESLMTSRSWLTQIPQRILSYGKNIRYCSSNVIAVYTEKDKGRISLKDIARHVLVNNETIVVEYYDSTILYSLVGLGIGGLAFFIYKARPYIKYRLHKSEFTLPKISKE